MREATIAGYLLLVCGAVAMTTLPRVRPHGFAPATSVLDDTLAGLFDLVVTGDDVARAKPDPEAYALAGSRLGCAPRPSGTRT